MSAMTPHLDDELLSAHLDGYPLAADATAHLRICSDCAARLSDLQTVTEAVGQPVALATADRRQAHLAAALASARSEAEVRVDGRAALAAPVLLRRRRQWPAWVGAAATVALLAAGGVALAQLGGQAAKSSLARAGSTQASPAAVGGAVTSVSPANSARAPVKSTQSGDLGAQNNLSALADAVQARVSPTQPDAYAATPATPAAKLAQLACLDQATTDAAAHGVGRADPVYSATVQWRGRPAIVVAWTIRGTTATTRPSLRIEVMSLPGCQPLASQTT